MKILMLHKYGRKAASFRYRLEQYVPYLEKAGFDCTLSPLLDDEYLEQRLRHERRVPSIIVKSILRQLKMLTRTKEFDLVIVACDVFPYFPALYESYLTRIGIPYIYDFDDAIFHYYDQSPWVAIRALLGQKIKKVVRGAAAVFAGSPYLVDYSKQVNERVELLPTVVDLAVYRRTKTFVQPRSGPFIVGWIGSPTTALSLKQIEPALVEFCRAHDAKVVLVGSGPVALSGFPLEVRDWREDSEIDDILSFDVGIMPLSDTSWSRGKCGFKLIQYMACGIPVIASPVGANPGIVTPDVEGFLPADLEGWLASLENLERNAALSSVMGAAGRARVEKEFCLAVTAPKFVAGVARALGKIRPAPTR